MSRIALDDRIESRMKELTESGLSQEEAKNKAWDEYYEDLEKE